MEQRVEGNSGTVGSGTEDQRNSRYRGPVEQWVQRTSGTVGTENQWNSGYREPVKHWAQRTSGTVGVENERNRGDRGPEEQ